MSLRRTAKLPEERSSFTLSSGTVISPATSLLKVIELPTPRSSVPESWSPLVKRITSGAGFCGPSATALPEARQTAPMRKEATGRMAKNSFIMRKIVAPETGRGYRRVLRIFKFMEYVVETGWFRRNTGILSCVAQMLIWSCQQLARRHNIRFAFGSEGLKKAALSSPNPRENVADSKRYARLVRGSLRVHILFEL